jgi:hypothetical protein
VLGGVWVLAVGGGLALLTAFGVLDVDRAGQTAVVGLWSLLVASYVVALGVALWAVLEEARLFGAIPRRRTHTVTYAAGHPESSQDVAAWYAALPGEQRSASSRLSPGTLNAGFLLGILFGSAGLLALGLMSAAAVVAARRARELGPETAEAAELLEAKIGASSGQTRKAWSSYLPQREDISDSGARRLVRSLIETERAPGAAPSYPVDPTEVVARLAPDTLGHGVAAAFRTVSRELPADTARLLSILSQHPRTALLRRIARAPAADIFGSALDRPIGTYGTLDRLASPPYGAFRTAAHANVLSALLATRRRDWDTAALRLGENVAIAEHFLKAPSVFANRYGVGMLQQLALLPLAEVELARGNRDQAQTLVTAGDQVREEVLGRAWPGRLAGLAADPHDLSRFSAALRSDRLSPGYRVESFSGGWAGFCLNRWEILSGLSRLREPAVLRIGESMTDVPHAGELARLTAGMWERESGAVLGDVIGRLRWCWGISR